MDCIVHRVAESDMTKQLSLSLFTFLGGNKTKLEIDLENHCQKPKDF